MGAVLEGMGVQIGTLPVDGVAWDQLASKGEVSEVSAGGVAADAGPRGDAVEVLGSPRSDGSPRAFA
jgi:hypothetical protein